jgi:hypothetical protein
LIEVLTQNNDNNTTLFRSTIDFVVLNAQNAPFDTVLSNIDVDCLPQLRICFGNSLSLLAKVINCIEVVDIDLIDCCVVKTILLIGIVAVDNRDSFVDGSRSNHRLDQQRNHRKCNNSSFITSDNCIKTENFSSPYNNNKQIAFSWTFEAKQSVSTMTLRRLLALSSSCLRSSASSSRLGAVKLIGVVLSAANAGEVLSRGDELTQLDVRFFLFCCVLFSVVVSD